MNVLRPSVFPPGVVAAQSTRAGGVSPPPLGMNLSFKVGDSQENVVRNRLMFFGGLGIPPDRLAIPGQVHGTSVRLAKQPGDYPETDGLLTDQPGVFLCVSTADCVPVLLFDPVRRVVGAVHAGWRGTAAGIVALAVQMMVKEFGTAANDVHAYLGPAAGACCYYVGQDLESQFPAGCVAHRDGKTYVDLKETNRRMLLATGVIAARVETSPFCTISDSTLFHSHRRDGSNSGRMMAVIGLIA